jgi:hypothetical protein
MVVMTIAGPSALGEPQLLAAALQPLPQLMGSAGNALHENLSPFLDMPILSIIIDNCKLSNF